jgi:beta-phosphoglucomutase-like phosphatase (HAD superfamily)
LPNARFRSPNRTWRTGGARTSSASFTEFATRRYPTDEAPKIAAAALEVFESQLRRFLAGGGGVPIPGAENAIRRLRAAGIKVVLTSGFDRGLIADIVAHCGWGELFDAIVYPDEVPAGPHPT